jgi:hypothetical protein
MVKPIKLTLLQLENILAKDYL